MLTRFFKPLLAVLVFSTSSAYAIPGKDAKLPQPPEAPLLEQSYDFSGIVSLASCSGSLVRFDDSLDTDKAMVLTNGHCVKFIPPGEVLYKQASRKNFGLLSAEGKKIATLRSTTLLYATMTKTDFALYELDSSFKEISDNYGIEALSLDRNIAAIGTKIEVISGYWKRGYSCEVETFSDYLQEGDWLFEQSLRYSRPGCEVIGGTSGSPVIAAGTRRVIAVNNTINERGQKCSLSNPCEIDELGNIVFEKGYGYAQQTSWVYTCRDNDGKLDLSLEGCLLPSPIK